MKMREIQKKIILHPNCPEKEKQINSQSTLKKDCA